MQPASLARLSSAHNPAAISKARIGYSSHFVILTSCVVLPRFVIWTFHADQHSPQDCARLHIQLQLHCSIIFNYFFLFPRKLCHGALVLMVLGPIPPRNWTWVSLGIWKCPCLSCIVRPLTEFFVLMFFSAFGREDFRRTAYTRTSDMTLIRYSTIPTLFFLVSISLPLACFSGFLFGLFLWLQTWPQHGSQSCWCNVRFGFCITVLLRLLTIHVYFYI